MVINRTLFPSENVFLENLRKKRPSAGPLEDPCSHTSQEALVLPHGGDLAMLAMPPLLSPCWFYRLCYIQTWLKNRQKSYLWHSSRSGDQKMFSVKDQKVNILDFVDPVISWQLFNTVTVAQKQP